MSASYLSQCDPARIEGLCCEHVEGLNEAIAARDAVLARLKPGERYSRDMVVAEMEARAARREILVNRIRDLEAENAELRRTLSERGAKE